MIQKEKRAHPFTGEPEETTAGATEQLGTHTKSEYVQDATRSSDAVPLILDRIRLHKPNATDGKGRPMGKAPLLSGWRRLPALTEAEVAAHLAKGLNVGARLRDDQLVIDADPRHYEGGVNSLDRLIADFSIPHGPIVETGGGGRHLYFCKPEGMRVRDTLDGYPGVEFKTVGRQVVVPPSVHPNGRGYEWDALFGSDMTVPDVPDALLDRLRRPPRPSAVPDGTLPVSISRFMLVLYSRSTFRLSAFGRSFGDIHQMRVKASLTRDRSMLTHSTGEGRRAGLYQMNS